MSSAGALPLPSIDLAPRTAIRTPGLAVAAHPAAPWCVAGAFSAFGWLISLMLFLNLHMFMWDIGTFDQVVWNTAHGRWFASSIEVDNFMGDHFAPILAVLGLLHHVVPSPFLLMIVQSLCFTLSGAWVATIVRRQTGNAWLAWAAGLLMWCHPACFGIIINDYSVLTCALPAIIGLYWFGRSGRTGLAVLMAVILLCVREDAPIAMAAVGVLLCCHHGRRRLGLILVVVGLAAPPIGQWVLIPFFRGGEIADSNYRMILPRSWAEVDDVLLAVALGRKQWLFIGGWLGSTGFLLLLTRWRVLALLLSMGHLLLIPSTLGLAGHYGTLAFGLTGVLLIVLFCDEWPRLVADPRRGRLVRAWVGLTVAISVGVFLHRDVRGRAWVLRPSERAAQFEEVAAFLPPEAPVAASLNVGSRIAHRRALYLWPPVEYLHFFHSPEVIERAEYIFTDARRERAWGREDEIQALVDDPSWSIVHRAGDLTLFKRVAVGPTDRRLSRCRPLSADIQVR